MKEQTFSKAYDHVMCDSRYSFLARNIYCRLARFTENDRDAFTSQLWLCEEFGLKANQVKQVKNAIKELKDAGFITAKQRGNCQSNRYTVNGWPDDAMKEKAQIRADRVENYSDGSKSTLHLDSDGSKSTLQEVPQTTLIRDKSNRQTTNIVDKPLEGEEEIKPFESKATAYVRNKTNEVAQEDDDSFTVSPLPVPVSSLTVVAESVIEFSNSTDAYEYVKSMGSQITQKEFNYQFGSTGKYEELELSIHIKKVYG